MPLDTSDFPADRELVLERIIDVPAEKLYRCWATAELMPLWFCPKPWTVSDVRLDVRGWDPGAVGARVVAEGATQRAEVVLDRASLAAWVEALRRVAAGERPDSMLAVGDVEVVVRTTGGAGR